MQEAFTAATRLLNEQDDASLRYAALELRRCLEALVYEKLKTYRDVLPEGSVSRWQPPQAFEALIEIEPEAQETYTLPSRQKQNRESFRALRSSRSG